MLKDYYDLAKPGLVYGNLVTVIAGFLVGEAMVINLVLLFATMLGIALVMAGGCVLNNVIDRDIDGEMGRTKDRAIVAGRISKRVAITYGICLAVAGFAALALWTTTAAVIAASIGFFVYVVAYSTWAKRRTVWGTAVGSIAGAVPPVVGYCAASGRFDLDAALLFATLILWQMPHFYSIAIYRLDDYAAAGIPVLPVRRGIRAAKINMLLYIIAFTAVAPLLAVFGYAGRIYFVTTILLGLAWLALCIKGFWNGGSDITTQAAADKQWARKMFFLSLAVMVLTFITLAADQVLRIFSLG